MRPLLQSAAASLAPESALLCRRLCESWGLAEDDREEVHEELLTPVGAYEAE